MEGAGKAKDARRRDASSMCFSATARAIFILSRCMNDSSDSGHQERIAAQMLEVIETRECACRAPQSVQCRVFDNKTCRSECTPWRRAEQDCLAYKEAAASGAFHFDSVGLVARTGRSVALCGRDRWLQLAVSAHRGRHFSLYGTCYCEISVASRGRDGWGAGRSPRLLPDLFTIRSLGRTLGHIDDLFPAALRAGR